MLWLLPLALSVLVVSGCPDSSNPAVAKDPNRYRKIVTAFHTAVVAMNSKDPERAKVNLQIVTKLAPKEPAGWANLGLQQIRGQAWEPAAKSLARAHELAPRNGEIMVFSALLEIQQGKIEKAVAYLRQVLEIDASHVRALGMLIDQLERLAAPGWEQEVEQLYEQALAAKPGNLAAQLSLARLAAKQGDREKFKTRLAALAARAETWNPDAVERLHLLERDGPGMAPMLLASNIQILTNLLVLDPQLKASKKALGRTDGADIGMPLERFISLPSPTSTPAPPDDQLQFAAETAGSTRSAWATALLLAPAPRPDDSAENKVAPQPVADARPAIVALSGGMLTDGAAFVIPFPGASPTAQAVVPIDWNNDYRPDLALVGSGGLRLIQQSANNQWADVTSKAALPPAVSGAAYTAGWAADVDLDGDLDLILSPVSGDARVLRNNADGTWKAVQPFPGVKAPQQWTWADIDGDGDADAGLLDGAGTLTVMLNERGGHFRRAELGDVGKGVRALSIADVDHEGTLDLVTLSADGTVQAITTQDAKQWTRTELTQWSSAPSTGPVRLLWGDLDNNGGADLVAAGPSGGQVWLQDQQHALQPLTSKVEAKVFAIADLNGDERLDLVGIGKDGYPVRLLNRGTKNYHWQVIRPRDKGVVSGDDKINAFGIGGEAELRSGLLVQKLSIDSPRLHFGLGEYTQAEVVRLSWPNGQTQGEFDLAADVAPQAVQRLYGSCPWLFAHDGKSVKFVTDALWKSPLGLRINAQDTAGVSQTRDWVKIRGDQLAEVDGYYDLRITAELWETDFFDYTSLMVVDHPANTEVFVDERFSIPQPKLEVLVGAPPVPVAAARDQQGRDVLETVRARDGKYLDTFPLGRYQGVAADHFVEVTLPEGVGTNGKVWLLANGWIFPTDSSINVAISQGSLPKPEGLSLELPDGKGGWKTVRRGLGFPAGKYKTVRIDLTGLYPAGSTSPRRLRLRTNMEIYWDALAVATPAPAGTPAIRTREIKPDTAELRYRGFSEIPAYDRSTPETPDYSRIAGTSPQWLDLVGFYTRFGDVRELLTRVEDRYVIMNAGDELRLRFPAPAPPPAGWKRDYVFVSDGWDKDGNFNTSYSTTLLPLPSHDRPAYNTPPVPLHEDPVFLRSPQDWVNYHTRYVSTERFRKALRPSAPE